MDCAEEFEFSIRYLKSNEALKSLDADPYWPKWHSPWWHMLLLYEMGLVKEIPESIISPYILAFNKMPLKIFPIYPEEMPKGLDPYRASPCHCQVGNVYQVLAAWGIDVDENIPWLRPWILNYQMADGGLNCDSQAYLAKDEVPSSMVGTISAFEAILLYTKRAWTSEEKIFLNKGAHFLIDRQLTEGSLTKHNAEERTESKEWFKLCFPRFYFYDVLRGLNALLLWGEKMNAPVPLEAFEIVMSYIDNRFPDGLIRNERHSFENTETILHLPSGEWVTQQRASFFPLLTKVSAIGEVSPFLSKRWAEAKKRLK
jgi:hypothetical protein